MALLPRLLLISACLVALAEAGVRLFVVAPAAIQPHQELGWLYVPNASVLHTSEGYASHTMNASGFNDRTPGNAQEPHLVVLGDSFVEALQVDASDNFTSVAESLSSCTHVLNAGRSGISPLHFSALYAHASRSVTVTGMVATLSPGDFRDIRSAKLETTVNETGQIIDLNFEPSKLNPTRLKLDRVLRHSALATYALNRLKALRAAPANPANERNRQPDDINELRRAGEILNVVMSRFEQTHPKAVLYLPELNYLPDRRAEPTELSTRFLELVTQAARRHDMVLIDTTDALIQWYELEGQPGHGFANNSMGNGHLNPDGHRVVAQRLADWLEQSGVCR